MEQAGARLDLSPSTIASQIHALEDTLGKLLFIEREGKLQLTEDGQETYRHADEIFGFFSEWDYNRNDRKFYGSKTIREDSGSEG